MKVIIHRGTHQIGGCITEIESNKGTKVAIDIGKNLPSINGKEKEEIEVEGLNVGKPNFEAIFVTHYHGDHIGMYNKINPEIPIYMGKISYQIFKMLQNRLLEAQIISEEDIKSIEHFTTFRVKEQMKIDDITITPFQVDHSAFDAYMFLVECDGKRLLHTGDFRTHGQRGKAVIPTLEKYVKNIDCLICEGTTLSRKREVPMTEFELQKKAEKIFKENKNNFVMCSSTNIDRIAAIHKASISSHKLFVCDNYQKEILTYVNSISRSDLYKFNRNVYSYDKNLDDIMNKNGFVMLVRDNYLSKNILNKYPNNKFIYSQWDGYLNPKFTLYKHMQEFVPKDHIYLHTSGHADYMSIKSVCETVKPKIILPIHGENPEAFKEMRTKRINNKNIK